MTFVLLDFDGDVQAELYVTLEIRSEPETHATVTRTKGKLPTAQSVITAYQQWRSLYDALWGIYRLGEASQPVFQGSPQGLMQQLATAGDTLTQTMNHWLRAESFRPVREKLLEKLQPSEEICCILQTADPWLRRLPWHLWDFLDRYPHAEIALSTPSYETAIHSSSQREQVRILAVLGHAAEIDVQRDRHLLAQLPHAQVQILAEPSRQDLHTALWDAQGWDILCFSGHSTTSGEGDRGYLTINAQDTLHLGDIAHALKKAVKQGLKVAIFNSCDGLGLAHQIEPFAIPNTIIMREPVPDPVAQAFLKGFLQSFCQGQPLPLAVRESRERLQALEGDCPFASWLPVLFQNPAQRHATERSVPTLYWGDLYPAPAVIPPSPYRGLAAFTPADAAVFCGRDETVEVLTYAVYTKPFVALLGASGSGKSSLVFAGLLPRLVQDAIALILRPTADPLEQLITALLPRLNETDWTAETLRQALIAKTVTLTALLTTIGQQQSQSRVLLVVDQFEELYTLCTAVERNAFLQILLSLLPPLELDTATRERSRFSPHPTLIITLRADFLEAALADPLLATVFCTYSPELLRPMGRESLRIAIEQPAQQQGVQLATGLTDRILDAVGETPGKLPLLEFTLTLLWEQQHQGQLTHEAYDAIGGVETALVTYAEGVYRHLSPEQQHQARHIFVQLVHPGIGMADTRRLAARDSFGDTFDSVLTHLASQRLIVLEQQTVELVHEVLITAWARLQTWLEEDRSLRIWQERLRQELAQWQQFEQPDDRLLQGAALMEAQHWLADNAAALSEAERNYIELSGARSRREQQRRKRLQGLLIGGFVTASLLAGVSLWQWQQAVLGHLSTQLSMLSGASEQLFASRKELDGLLASIRAVNQVRDARGNINPESRMRAIATLQQAVYGIRELNRLEGHERTVIDVAYSPDGEHLVSVGDDRTVRLWNQDGTLLKTLADHSDLVRSVSWHPNGQRFITASYDRTLRLWRRDGQLLATWEGHEAEINRVAWSPDGTAIASIDGEGEVILWSAAGEIQGRWQTNQGWLMDVAWTTDSQGLAIAGGKTVQVWDTQGRRQVQLTHEQTATAVTVSPDGQTLATSDKGGNIALWTVQGRLINRWLGHSDRIWSVNWSSDGRKLTTASADKTIKVWNPEGELLKTLAGHNASTYRAIFHPTAPHLVSASADTTIRIWHLTGRSRPKLAHRAPVNGVQFHPHSDQLVTGTQAGDIQLWRRDGRRLRRLQSQNKGVWGVQFSPDGLAVLSVGVNHRSQAQTLNGEVKTTYLGDLAVDTSPDGRWLVTGSNQPLVRLWQRNGEPLQTLKDHQAAVTATRFSPDGRLLATGSEDETLRIWQRRGDRFSTQPLILRGHGSRINQLAWTPDGQTLASASDDGTIRLWQRTRTQQFAPRATQVLRGHLSKVRAIVFSPDGQILASGSDDGTVKLWTLQGNLLITFQGHEDAVWSLDFSPDGQWLASASADQRVILWNLDLYFLLDQGCDWLGDYLSTNPSVSPSDRRLCAL